MARLNLHPGSRFGQFFLEAAAALVCGVLLGYWISTIGAGAPLAIPPRVTLAQGEQIDPLDRIMTTAPLFGSRRPGGPARNIVALGLISDASGNGGAIVAVEGQPPRAVRVGDRIEGRLVTAIDAKGLTLEGSSMRDTVPLSVHPQPALHNLSANSASPVALRAPGQAMPQTLGSPIDNGAAPVTGAVSGVPPGYTAPPPESLTGRQP